MPVTARRNFVGLFSLVDLGMCRLAKNQSQPERYDSSARRSNRISFYVPEIMIAVITSNVISKS